MGDVVLTGELAYPVSLSIAPTRFTVLDNDNMTLRLEAENVALTDFG